MHYAFEFTVSPVDTVDSPLVESMILGSGIIKEVVISFPYGCADSVRCYLCNDSIQLLPINQDGYYSGDGFNINASLWYDLVANTNKLYFVGWSVDAAYDHVIKIFINVKEDNEPDMVVVQSRVVELVDHVISLVKSYL